VQPDGVCGHDYLPFVVWCAVIPPPVSSPGLAAPCFRGD
jgi:hypothetical protein